MRAGGQGDVWRACPAHIPGQVGQQVLDYLQSAGHPAKAVLPLKPCTRGICGALRGQLRPEDDLRLLPVQGIHLLTKHCFYVHVFLHVSGGCAGVYQVA